MLKVTSNFCVTLVLLALVVLTMAGCQTPIGADKVSPREAYLNLHRNALTSDHYSDEARRVLHRYNLEETFPAHPEATLKELQAIACRDERRDVIYALSELSYWNAECQSNSPNPAVRQRARDSYLAASIYAYFYLLAESTEGRPNPFDLRLRTACDLYNRGLALGLIEAKDARADLAAGPRATPPGVVEVRFTPSAFSLPLNQVQAFYSADEFVVRGLSTRNRDSGLGAPLVAVIKNADGFQDKQYLPATVFLRVQGTIRDWNAGTLAATLELYSTLETGQVEVNGRSVPLQTDTTAAMALRLDNRDLWSLGVAQFFSPEASVKPGIRRTQPYAPGKIPVVFVHGTASSPVWWAEMLNTLRSDPVLRQRYQFWAFYYPSGNPITYSAGLLRQDLLDQIKTLDPEGKDPALRQMVVIGHSQGGIVTKLTATDTGDKLWRLVSPTDLDALKVDAPTRELLRSHFFFKPLPCVSRVIFIATPHRGSYPNSRFVQKLVSRFMSFPSDVIDASARLLKLKETIRLPDSVRKGVPTSLNGMATDNPFMLTLADIPTAPGITAHSIIAVDGDEKPPEGADGLVKYTSAHVDYAASEFIVRSVHSCQMNPLTIEEVRRILHEHLAAPKTPKADAASTKANLTTAPMPAPAVPFK